MNTVHLVNIVHEVKQGTYKDSTTAALEPESVAVGSFAQAGARENAANIFELYDRYGVQPPLNDLQRDVLLDAAEAYSPDQLDFAFRDAADHGKRNWPYIRAILERLRTSPEPGNVAGRIGPTLVVDERQKWRDAAAEHNPPVERIGAAMTVIGLPATTAPIDSDVQVVAPSADIPGDILDGWLRVMGQLKDQVDAAVYQQVSDTYVAALKDDATLVLAVPRHYGAELLRGRIFKTVTRLLRDLMRPGLGLEVVVGQPPTGPEPKQLGQALRGAAWMQTIVQREREAVT